MATRLEQVSATGKVQDGSLWLKSVVLAGGSAAATLLIQDTTDGSGTDVLKLAAATGDSAVWQSPDSEGVYFANAIYATLSGAGAVASFEYE